MTHTKVTPPFLYVTLLAVAMLAGLLGATQDARAQSAHRVFEMRTYYTHEGKLDDLQARFRNHTIKVSAIRTAPENFRRA